MKPTRAGLPLLRLGLSVVLLGWVIAKCIWLTGVELARFVVRVMAHPDSASQDGLRWLGLKIEVPIVGSTNVPSLLLTIGALLAVFRFKVGMIPTLIGCCVAGILLHLLGVLS